MNKERKIFTREQAAEYLGLPKRRLDDWAWNKRQELPYMKMGKLVRYLKSDLDKWLESKKVTYDQKGK